MDREQVIKESNIFPFCMEHANRTEFYGKGLESKLA